MQGRKERGYTLLELLIVIALVAMIAAIAVPANTRDDEVKLDRAAANISSAFRFARSEAIRTGAGHGLTVSQSTQKITVKQYDITAAPISTIGTSVHPIDKQPYDFNVNTNKSTQGVLISNSSDIFNYGSEGRRRSMIFDANGIPLWIIGSDPARHLLVDGTVELSLGNHLRRVSVEALTGRVTVQ